MRTAALSRILLHLHVSWAAPVALHQLAMCDLSGTRALLLSTCCLGLSECLAQLESTMACEAAAADKALLDPLSLAAGGEG